MSVKIDICPSGSKMINWYLEGCRILKNGLQAKDVEQFKPAEIKENDRPTSVGDPKKFYLVSVPWLLTVQTAMSCEVLRRGSSLWLFQGLQAHENKQLKSLTVA